MAQQQAVAVVATPTTTGELVPSVPISSMALMCSGPFQLEDQVAYTVASAQAIGPVVPISSVAATVRPSEGRVAYTVASAQTIDPAVPISSVTATVRPLGGQVA